MQWCAHPGERAGFTITPTLGRLMGVLDGTERLERYRRVDSGNKEGHAVIELESLTEGNPGKVDLVPPYAIHAEQGGATRSVAVIVRSERLVGRTLQGGYDAKTDTYRQSEGPTQVPFEITESSAPSF